MPSYVESATSGDFSAEEAKAWSIINPLLEAGATPTAEDLMSDDVLKAICSLPAGLRRDQTIALLLNKCPRGSRTATDRLYKSALHQAQRDQKQSSTNYTNFTDLPSGVLNFPCGQFTANDYGVTGVDEYGQTVFVSNSPIMIKRLLRDVETGEQRAELLYKREGRWVNKVVGMPTIGNSIAIQKLSAVGVDATSENAKLLVSYLRALQTWTENIPIAPMCSRCGWQTYDGQKLFMPFIDNIQFGGEDEYGRIFRALQPRGDYEAWKTLIKPFYEQNNRVMRGMLAASFAAPILGLLRDLPFVVHLWGGTGNHKSAALMVAASAWGDPSQDADYVASFDSTRVGNERRAHFLNNLPVFLDELGTHRGSMNLSSTVYELCQGKGRSRGTAKGGVESATNWCTVFVSTGEYDISADTDAAGAKNRVLHINTRGEKVFGSERAAQVACNTVKANYGRAGREFIARLTAEYDEDSLRAMVLKYESALEEYDTTGKQALALSYLMVADELAQKILFGEMITDEGDLGWATDMLISAEDVNNYRRTKDRVDTWIAANWERHFDIDARDEIWGRATEDENATAVTSTSLRKYIEEECGQSFSAFLDDAERAGDLIAKNRSVRINGKVVKCMILKTPRVGPRLVFMEKRKRDVTG